MKFGELRVYCSELSPQILGAIRAEATAGARAEILFFCPLNNARFHRLPVGPDFTKFAQKDVFPCALWGLENICENLPVRDLFFGLIKVNDFRLPAAVSPK